MADEGLNVNGGPLQFEASIDDKDYLKGIDSMLNASRKLHDTESKRFELQIAAQREVGFRSGFPLV